MSMQDQSAPTAESTPVVHLHAASFWHDDAWIVGNREGLEQLRAAIDRALDKGGTHASAFVNDGEGFTCFVALESDADMNRLNVPYTDEVARGPTQGWHWPHEGKTPGCDKALASTGAYGYRG